MLLSFTACSKNNKTTELNETYKSKAEEFITSGDIDSAIKVLEEGISVTNNDELKKMLDDLRNENINTSSVDDSASEANESISDNQEPMSYDDYTGIWATEDISYDNGGLILDISIKNSEMIFSCSLTSSAPSLRVAEFENKISISQIKNNMVTIDFKDDGWDSYGTFELTFNNDYLLADFKNVVNDPASYWGFNNRTYKLIKNEQAHTTFSTKPFNIDDYFGYWATSDDIFTNGGFTMTISESSGVGGVQYIQLTTFYSQPYWQDGPSIELVVEKSSLANGKIETSFADNFGIQGFITIEFLENSIKCTVTNVNSSEYYGEGNYVLTY